MLAGIQSSVAVGVEEIPVHVSGRAHLEAVERGAGLRRQNHAGKLVRESIDPGALPPRAAKQQIDASSRSNGVDDGRVVFAVAVDVADARHAAADVEVALEDHVRSALLEERPHEHVVDVPPLELVVRRIPGAEVETDLGFWRRGARHHVLHVVFQVQRDAPPAAGGIEHPGLEAVRERRERSEGTAVEGGRDRDRGVVEVGRAALGLQHVVE